MRLASLACSAGSIAAVFEPSQELPATTQLAALVGLPRELALSTVHRLRRTMGSHLRIIVDFDRADGAVGEFIAAGVDDFFGASDQSFLFRLEIEAHRTAHSNASKTAADLLEQANDAIYTVDFEGRFIAANAAGERLTGYGRDQLIGMPMSDLLDEESLAAARSAIAAKVAGSTDSSIFEVNLATAQGTVKRVEISSRLVFEDGRPYGIQGIARDITGRHTLERDIAFRAELLDRVNAATFAADAAGRVLFWNTAAQEMFGYSREEALGRTFQELILGRPVSSRGKDDLSTLAAGTSYQRETTLRRKDGSTFAAHVTNAPVLDAAGEVIAGISVCLDLTERREQEAQLSKLAAIVESADAAVIARDLDGLVTSWNPAAERMFGVPKEQAIGRRMRRIIPEDIAEEAFRNFNLTSEGSSLNTETFRLKADGRRFPVRVSTFPVRDAAGNTIGTANLTYDLTDKVAAETALRESEDRYRAAADLSLDSFAILQSTRDPDGRIVDFTFVDMNKAAERLVTIPRAKAIGGSLSELIPVSRSGGFIERYSKVVETGELLDEEFAIEAPEVAATWLHQTVVKFGDGVAITSRDISARKQAEAELAAVQNQIVAIFESTAEGILLVSPELKVIAANRSLSEGAVGIFGRSPLPGDDVLDFSPEVKKEEFEQLCRAALSGEPCSVEWPITTLGGRAIWVEFSFSPVSGIGESVQAVAIITRDATERRTMEHELASREAALRTVFESMNEAMMLIDPERRFILANPLAINRVRQLRQTEPVPGGDLQDYLLESNWSTFCELHAKALAGERPTTELLLPDQVTGVANWWEYAFNPVHDDDGEIVAVTMTGRDIDARKKAEISLKEAEQLVRTLVENAPIVLFGTDASGTFTFSSGGSLSSFGGGSQGLVGRSAFDEGAGAPAVTAALRRALDGESVTIETTIGETTWDARYVPIRDERGLVSGAIGLATDITARREAEAARLALAVDYAAVVENTSDAIFVLDVEGDGPERNYRVALINPAFVQLTGIETRAIGKLIQKVLPPDFLRGAVKRYEQAIAARETIHYEEPVPVGEIPQTLVTLTPLFDENGRCYRLIGSSRDLTERLRAEAALREKAADLDAVFASSHEAIVLISPEKRILALNEAFVQTIESRRLGTPQVGDEMTAWLPETAHDGFNQDFQRAMAGESFSYERELNGKSGTSWWELSYAPVVLEGGTPRGVVLGSRDISERKRTTEALAQTQKLESLAVLAGGIAHDFNNLLVGILGNAGLALMELSPASPARPTIEAIEIAGQRAAELARQMLAYSGRGRFLVEDVELNSLVEEMAHLLRVSIGKGVRLTFRLANDLPAVQADATQLRQVVMNLVVNASDAIGDSDGVVSISTSSIEATKELLADTYLSPELPAGRYVVVDVTDTGSGMDPETLSRVFDPFFTTKFTGRGLGLAAVLGIMRGHRGAIKVQSEPGQGTTFRLLLPAVLGVPQLAEPKKPAGAWRGAGTVLVVDDEPTVRAVTSRAVSAFGFTPLEAVDGLAGLEAFTEHADEIVCVLLDMTMPRMNGEETFVAIKKVRPDARIILMSGYTEQDATERFSGRGLSGFIQKPYELRTLREMLQSVVESPNSP